MLQMRNALDLFSELAVIAVTLGIGGIVFHPNLKDIANAHPTYLTPSNIVLGLFWSIEFLGLFACCGVGFTASNAELLNELVGPWLAVANSGLILWTFCWLREAFLLSIIPQALTVASLATIQYHFSKHFTQAPSRILAWLVLAPICSYMAWIWCDIIYSVFVAAQNYGWTEGGVIKDGGWKDVLAAIIGIGSMGMTPAIYAIRRCGGEGGWVAATSALYSLAIALNQSNSIVRFAASVMAALLILEAIWIWRTGGVDITIGIGGIRVSRRDGYERV